MTNTASATSASIPDLLGPRRSNNRYDCPICSTKGSVAFDVSEGGKPLLACHGKGGKTCNVYAWVKNRGGPTRVKLRTNDNRQDETARFHQAFKILRAAKVANAGKP